MPFLEVDIMDSRRKLVLDVSYGMSLAQACRIAGITRPTGRKWVRRAREVGVEGIAELSRAPHRVANHTDKAIEARLLGLKTDIPVWGAKKLTILLKREHGIDLPVRTADRILARNGLTRAREKTLAPVRFEKEVCGEMLQMDFKGLPKSAPYSLLSVLDDHGRFCFHFGPVKDKSGASVIDALWALFGLYGVPESMLMDNGDCWGSSSNGPTAFEAWLMRCGVHPKHGSICHPQTQGKVERFHETVVLEMGSLIVQPSAAEVAPLCERFVHRYNWIRPHEALQGQVPGSRFAPFARKRPERHPVHNIAPGAITRVVDQEGRFSYKGTEYLIGRGLHRERVVLSEAEHGLLVSYAGFPLRYLSEL
jgi:transposase InsO family protein